MRMNLVSNSCYYTSVSPNHRVLPISVESNNLRSPTCIQRIQNATDHGSNVLWSMTIIKGHYDQVQILQRTIGTNADFGCQGPTQIDAWSYQQQARTTTHEESSRCLECVED